MSAFVASLRREIALRMRGGGTLSALGLFAITSFLAPLALGRDPDLLAAAGPPVLWIAAIFSVLIGLDGLFEEDLRTDALALYRLTPLPLPVVVLIKIGAAWSAACLPLVLAAPLVLASFGSEDIFAGTLGFLLGTPGIALVAGTVGALCAGLRRGTALLVFLALPLLAPALVFGPASAGPAPAVPLLFLGAFSLQALAICPVIASAALRTQMS